MEAVVGLLVMLLGVSHGVETYCDGRQDGTQCFGALGGTLVLRLMNSTSGVFRYRWSNSRNTILHGRYNMIIINLIGNRSLFTHSNGTFRINNLNLNDSGEYKLDIFDSNGKNSEQRTLQLTFQAPVSSVMLVPECLSQGEMRASCSSEGGDSPQYSWTLNGQTLTDAQLLSGNNETSNITLKQNVVGQLVCSVRNRVSNVSKEETISSCGFTFIDCVSPNGTRISQWVLRANNTLCIEPTTTSAPISTVGKESETTVSSKPSNNVTSSNQSVTSPGRDDPWYINYLPILGGVCSALVVVLLFGVAVVYALKKKQNNKLKEEEDDQELTYADVRVVRRQGGQVQQRANMEVEYGEVKFSERPRPTVEPTGDGSVYAKVRRGR